jgi:chemotaxis protein methyltransferase CheR
LLQAPGAEQELGHLIDAISTNHTFFFREKAHFDFLRDKAVPEFIARARVKGSYKLRVWSAACSSGEEPYSIAMTLAGCLPGWQWGIDATDISRRVLAKGAAGVYNQESISRLPLEMVRTYLQRGFGPQAGNFRVKAWLRDRVSFNHLNLLEGPPPFTEPFHVIFCRNVMIYFDEETQAELVTRLSQRLVPGGYLFVGHSESLTHLHPPLDAVQPAVYRKSIGP